MASPQDTDIRVQGPAHDMCICSTWPMVNTMQVGLKMRIPVCWGCFCHELQIKRDGQG